LKTCEEYADAFSTKAFCFDDLKSPLHRLDKKRLQAFRAARGAAEQNTLEQLFALELEYSLLPSDSGEAQTKDLIDFASRALKLYHTSLSETSPPPCPEAALLSVLAILRLGTTAPINKNGQQQIDHNHTVRAMILLETVRSAFEDFYALTVVLIRLKAYLGQLSSAMATFTKLSVKNMQYETVAHLILTRISSLHPAATTYTTTNTTNNHSSESIDTFDPLSAIETGLTVLENADNALVRGIREGLRFNSYSNIHNSVDMRLQLRNSASRRVYAVEERKLRRLRGLADDNTVLDTEDQAGDGNPDTAVLADNRDFSYFPHFREDDDSLVRTGFQCGPLPCGKWVSAMALLDHVVTFLKIEMMGQGQQVGVGAKALENVKTAIIAAAGRESSKDENGYSPEGDGLTKAEHQNLECHRLLAEAALLIGGGDTDAPQVTVAQLLDQLKSWVQKTLDDQKERATTATAAIVAGIRIYTWDELHTSISRLETLQAIALLLGVLGKKSKTAKGSKTIPKDALAEIQALVGQLEGEIHGAARAVKEGIGAPGVLGKLVDLGFARFEGEDGEGAAGLGGLGDVLEKVSDEAQMETVCGRVRDSWEDALDGVLAVKVKLWK